MKIVITGGIGSGKSTVTKLLSEFLPGVKVISVDKIIETLYDNPEISQKLIDHVGASDKASVSDIVFRNKKMKEVVEQLFSSQIRLTLSKALQGCEDVIIEFPLLIEKGADYIKDFDVIISVTACDDVRIKRVVERNNFTVEKIESIIASQTTDYERSRISDYIIANDGSSLEDLKEKVKRVSYDLRMMIASEHQKKIGLISGSFDPITLGHQDIIHRALKIVDLVVIAIAFNPAKSPMFSMDDRIELIEESLIECFTQEEIDRIVIQKIPDDSLTVSFASRIKANFIFRGLRGAIDLDYESQLDRVQKKIADHIETIYLLTNREHIEISSSLIKNAIKFIGWEKIAKGYISNAVFKRLTLKVKGF